MPEVHLPHLDDEDDEDKPEAAPAPQQRRRGKRALKLALEVLLIGTGVFLGLAGEQWRESREHRERAQASLGRFHTELLDNKKAVADVREYHVTLRMEYVQLSQGMLSSMYINSPYSGGDAFLSSVAVYLDDVVLLEPQLLKLYDELLPKIEAVQER